jgi:hypothetical protein
MIEMELFFDAINGFDQIVLIAAREGHARYGKLNGNQRLMYCGLLRPIHGGNLNPFGGKPQALKRRSEGPAAGVRRPPQVTSKQKPRRGRGFRERQSADRYLAGAVDELSVVDFLFLLLLVLLLLLCECFL